MDGARMLKIRIRELQDICVLGTSRPPAEGLLRSQICVPQITASSLRPLFHTEAIHDCVQHCIPPVYNQVFNSSAAISIPTGTDRNKLTTNQNSLFRSRDW
eukprot:sb/3478441/